MFFLFISIWEAWPLVLVDDIYEVIAWSKTTGFPWYSRIIMKEKNSKSTKLHFLGGELLTWVICQDLSSPSLLEDNLSILNSCPIPVLQSVNIASCDQNVWQIQRTSLQYRFNLDIKSEIYSVGVLLKDTFSGGPINMKFAPH